MTNRQKKKLIQLIVGGLIVIGSFLYSKYQPVAQAPVTQAGYYNVSKFDDGDTIVVDMNGVDEKVRFIGVDTPETHDPRKPVQCFGKVAAEFTKNLIGNNQVRLEADPTNTNRDRYNRLLRYVYLPDGTLVNLEIIIQGYGFAYLSFPVQKADEFRLAQKNARENEKGLWSACDPEKNEYGGFSSPPEKTNL